MLSLPNRPPTPGARLKHEKKVNFSLMNESNDEVEVNRMKTSTPKVTLAQDPFERSFDRRVQNSKNDVKGPNARQRARQTLSSAKHPSNFVPLYEKNHKKKINSNVAGYRAPGASFHEVMNKEKGITESSITTDLF